MTDSRYQDDPNFRHNAKLRSRLKHFSTKPLVEIPPRSIYHTEIWADIEITNPDDVRCGQTWRTPLYKSGTLAKILDVGQQSLRGWEQRGIIPDSNIKIDVNRQQANVRAYTYDQVSSLIEILPLLNFTDARGMEHSEFSRNLRRIWGEMPDGVLVVRKEGA